LGQISGLLKAAAQAYSQVVASMPHCKSKKELEGKRDSLLIAAESRQLNGVAKEALAHFVAVERKAVQKGRGDSELVALMQRLLEDR